LHVRSLSRSSILKKGVTAMTDLMWLAILGGLFLVTLAFVRLCDAA
jgi:hypothetical protein